MALVTVVEAHEYISLPELINIFALEGRVVPKPTVLGLLGLVPACVAIPTYNTLLISVP